MEESDENVDNSEDSSTGEEGSDNGNNGGSENGDDDSDNTTSGGGSSGSGEIIKVSATDSTLSIASNSATSGSVTVDGLSGSGTSYTITSGTEDWFSVTNTYKRTGYVFSGWSITSLDGSTAYYGTSEDDYKTTTSTTLTYLTSDSDLPWYRSDTVYFKLYATGSTITMTAQWTAVTPTYDSSEGYWYLEDGEYPQSVVTDEGTISALDALYEAGSENEKYFSINGTDYHTYTYGDNEYIKVVISTSTSATSISLSADSSEISAWFLVEPIRWYVGAYTGDTELPANYSAGVSNDNLTLVSAYVITYGSISDSAQSGWAWNDSGNSLYAAAESVDVSQSIYNMYADISYDGFKSGLNQISVDSEAATTNTAKYQIASAEELDILGSYTASATDLVTFLSTGGATSASTGKKVSYWTRSLSYSFTSSDNYGYARYLGSADNAVYVASYGLFSNAWTNTEMGARLSMTVEEIYFASSDNLIYYYDSDYDSIAVGSTSSSIAGDVVVSSNIYYKGQLWDVTVVGGNGTNEYAAWATKTFTRCSSMTSIELPSTIRTIETNAFQNCTSLTSVIFHSGVETIGNYAFYGCTNLTVVTLPDSVTSLGSQAFRNCTNLQSITLSSGITSLNTYTFYGCTLLERIWISKSVTKITNYNFYNCSALTIYFEGTEAWVSSNVTLQTWWNSTNCPIVYGYSSDDFEFYGELVFTFDDSTKTASVSIYKDSDGTAVSMEEVRLPSSIVHYSESAEEYETFAVTSISDFSDSTELLYIWIPNSITSISSTAFSGCENLTVYFQMTQTEVNACSDINLSWKSEVVDVQYGFEESKYLSTIYDLEEDYVDLFVFSYNNTEMTATVRAASTSILGEIVIPGKIVHDGKVYDVIKIAAATDNSTSATGGFANCTQITSVTLPSTMQEVGSYAFANCTALETVNFNDGLLQIMLYSFYNCTALKAAILPDTVINMGSYCFAYCSAMEEVHISPNIMAYNTGVFYYCTALTEIDIPDGCGTSFAYYYVSNCYSLTSLRLPYGLTTVEQYGAMSNTSVTTLYIPDTVTNGRFAGLNNYTACTTIYTYRYDENGDMIYIKYDADGNESLWHDESDGDVTEWTNYLPWSWTSGFYSVFGNWKSLTYIHINNSVQYLGSRMFLSCSSLETIEILEGTSITSFSSECCSSCSSLKSIYIPDALTSIGYDAFRGCTSLLSMDLSNTQITSIGSQAFYNCQSLTEILLPDTLTTIDYYAFRNCYALTEIVIPDSVTSIGYGNFIYDYSLTTLTLPFVGIQDEETMSETAYSGLFGYYFPTSITNYKTYHYTATQYTSADDTTGTTRYLPNSLTTVKVTGGKIYYGAFMNCTSITSIYIGKNVTQLSSYAFSGLTDTTIYFEMTEQEFNDAVTNGSLIIGSDWNVSGCTVVFGATLSD